MFRVVATIVILTFQLSAEARESVQAHPPIPQLSWWQLSRDNFSNEDRLREEERIKAFVADLLREDRASVAPTSPANLK